MSTAAIPLASPPSPAGFRLAPGALYLAGLIAVAALLGFIAAQVAHYRAPWLVFPLAVGGVLGFLAGKYAELISFAHRATILFATVGAGVAVVGMMHYLEYRDFVIAPRSAHFEMFAKAFPDIAERHAAADAAGFWGFLQQMATAGRAMPFGWTAQGGWAWASWGVDAALLVGAAVALATVALRRPYCDTCHEYYRAVREQVVPASRLHGLASAVGWQVPSGDGTASCEALACAGACGPELVRVTVKLAKGRPSHFQAWIDPAERARLFQLLDQAV